VVRKPQSDVPLAGFGKGRVLLKSPRFWPGMKTDLATLLFGFAWLSEGAHV